MRIACLISAMALLLPCGVHAQSDFPVKNIRLLVGFPPGGSTDVLARLLAADAGKRLGQDILVVNRPGVTGALAVGDVVASPADGYTLGVTPSTVLTLTHLYQNIRPDLLENSGALLMVGRQRVGIAAKADSEIRTFRQFVEAARRAPGKLSVGIPGTGTLTELITRAVFAQEKLDVNIVPFQGDAPIITAIMGNHVTAGSFSAGGWAQQVRAGSMRLLASLEGERSEVAPDVPTLLELGYELKGNAIQYMFAPKGLPPAVRSRLIDAFRQASRTPTFIEVATKNALYDANAMAGDDLDQYLLKDRAGLVALAERLGVKKP
ncbi:MAG: Bug family tripartite tricarboxylate transporter substrate binding protein [Burkholderiales bacterium]